MKNYYELLSVEVGAPPEEIKRAFRVEIARYHPDKVQHLGQEFQEMAATRAAQLTEAYRTLMNADLRAEYDRLLQAFQAVPAGRPGAPAAAPSAKPQAAAPRPPPRVGPVDASGRTAGRPSSLFSEERSTKDELVWKATLGRIRQVLAAEFGTYSEMPVRGFDLVCATMKSTLFGRSRPVPNLYVRLVREVNRTAIQETWTMATKALGSGSSPVCVFLMGMVGSQRETNDAVAEQRRRAGKNDLLLIPVDIRDWSAQLPPDAPRTFRTILERLRKAS